MIGSTVTTKAIVSMKIFLTNFSITIPNAICLLLINQNGLHIKISYLSECDISSSLAEVFFETQFFETQWLQVMSLHCIGFDLVMM